MGDVKETKADNSNLKEWIGECRKTPLDKGIKNFITW